MNPEINEMKVNTASQNSYITVNFHVYEFSKQKNELMLDLKK